MYLPTYISVYINWQSKILSIMLSAQGLNIQAETACKIKKPPVLETNTQNTGLLRKFQKFLFDRGYRQSENEEA